MGFKVGQQVACIARRPWKCTCSCTVCTSTAKPKYGDVCTIAVIDDGFLSFEEFSQLCCKGLLQGYDATKFVPISAFDNFAEAVEDMVVPLHVEEIA